MDYTIDIVSRTGEVFHFEDLEVERVRAGDVTITVVTPATLYRMKRGTVRMRDRDDALRLARAFGLDDDSGRVEMAVTRYRSVEEMPEPQPAAAALQGLAAACASSVISRAFGHTSRAPRGVLRFSSIEEADLHRQQWESAVASGPGGAT